MFRILGRGTARQVLGANLFRATLTGAYLSRADLTDAELTDVPSLARTSPPSSARRSTGSGRLG
jgi:hypothetical protein